jgi:hypothetical protein
LPRLVVSSSSSLSSPPPALLWAHGGGKGWFGFGAENSRAGGVLPPAHRWRDTQLRAGAVAGHAGPVSGVGRGAAARVSVVTSKGRKKQVKDGLPLRGSGVRSPLVAFGLAVAASSPGPLPALAALALAETREEQRARDESLYTSFSSQVGCVACGVWSGETGQPARGCPA